MIKMNNVRDLSGGQIEALELGLTREQMANHGWGHSDTAQETLRYLRNHLTDITIQQAMNNVRDLSGGQIEALELGLTREQMANHGWGHSDTAQETLRYLRNRPDNVTVEQAMENVRGLSGDQIQNICEFQQRGIEELGFTPIQVRMGRFGQEQFERINNGEKYKVVMQKAFERMSNLETEKAYVRGATAIALSAVMPLNMGRIVGEFTTLSTGGILAQTSKSASKSANDERSIAQEIMDERSRSDQQNNNFDHSK